MINHDRKYTAIKNNHLDLPLYIWKNAQDRYLNEKKVSKTSDIIYHFCKPVEMHVYTKKISDYTEKKV